ncbi:MAG: hypothetical protein Q4C87_01430 [Actinomycetaceae bacterium]|nr:hypothetical protein [Actinomycetaceae bacterium]
MSEQRNPYRRDTEGAPISEGEAAPAHMSRDEAVDSPTVPSASYSPPRVHASDQAVARNETPLLITFLTIGVAAVAVAIFFVTQVVGSLGEVQWSVPDLSASTPMSGPSDEPSRKYEYREPERGPVNPNATQGMGEGKFEVPTDLWLHSGYAAGVSTWKATGEYIGVSRDKSIIAFYDEETGDITGRDVKTGTEKWRTQVESSFFMSCHAVWNGISYCSNVDSNKRLTFIVIDLATGKVTQGENTGIEGRAPLLIGYWQGYTYWNVPSTERVSEGDPLPPHTLISLKDEKVQWKTEIMANMNCTIGDGALGCSNGFGGVESRAEIINGTTGELVAEFTGEVIMRGYRDGFIIADRGSTPTTYRQYSWAAKDMGSVSKGITFTHPEDFRGNLLPISSVEEVGENWRFVDPAGQSLVELSRDNGADAYKDLSTQKFIRAKDSISVFIGEEKGTVYFLDGFESHAFFIVDENGTEIFSDDRGADDLVRADHGIVIRQNVDSSVTVYAPQG